MEKDLNFEFERDNLKFCFRNPKWGNRCNVHNELCMEYKVVGIHENKTNDGYYLNSTFIDTENAMSLNIKINGKEIRGVRLPEEPLKKIKKLYDEFKAKDLEKNLNKDIKYTLHDMTSYGIYNGISEFDIETIVWDIKHKFEDKSMLFSEEIAKILTKDEEIMKIADKTYVPYLEQNNWTDEYKNIYREAVKNKTAAGYGIVPNNVIKEKITKIIVQEVETNNNKKKKEEERIANLFKIAKETGEKQLISSWSEPCNDHKEECNLDFCYEYAMPDGSKEHSRTHTW